MPKLRSATTTQGRNMAGARALWRATGMKDNDFGKPIIARKMYRPGAFWPTPWGYTRRLGRLRESHRSVVIA